MKLHFSEKIMYNILFKERRRYKMKNKIIIKKYNIVIILKACTPLDIKIYNEYDRYIKKIKRNSEITSHLLLSPIFADCCDLWAVVDHNGNKLEISELDEIDGTTLCVKLAREGHIVFWDSTLSEKNPTYVMYHPTYLSKKQKEIIQDSFIELLGVTIEFYEVDQNGKCSFNKFTTNPETIEEYLIQLLHRDEVKNKELIKIKSNLKKQ